MGLPRNVNRLLAAIDASSSKVLLTRSWRGNEKNPMPTGWGGGGRRRSRRKTPLLRASGGKRRGRAAPPGPGQPPLTPHHHPPAPGCSAATVRGRSLGERREGGDGESPAVPAAAASQEAGREENGSGARVPFWRLYSFPPPSCGWQPASFHCTSHRAASSSSSATAAGGEGCPRYKKKKRSLRTPVAPTERRERQQTTWPFGN